MIRAVLAALAALFVAAGVACAADPTDLIGGTLSAAGHEATVTSDSTIPVQVTMLADAVSVSPATFTLDPGETGRVILTGPASGTLSAHLTALEATSGDTAAVTLQVRLQPPAPASSSLTWLVVLLAGIVAVLVALRRWRPWQLRIIRAPG